MSQGTRKIKRENSAEEKQFEIVYKDNEDLIDGNWLSYLCFGHLNKLARTYTKPNSDGEVELYRPPRDVIFENNKEDFLRYYSNWKAKNEKAKRSPPRLWKVIFWFVFKRWKWGFLFMFSAQIVQACAPFLLRAFLDWVQDEEKDPGRGLLIVGGRNLSLHHFQGLHQPQRAIESIHMRRVDS